MKPTIYFIIFAAAVTSLLASCQSAGKLYKQGNYDEAVTVAVKKLQKKPGDEEMQDLIRNAYRYAVTDHENRITGYAASTSDLRYDWIHDEYVNLQGLYNAIYRSPEVFELVRPVDYSSQVISFRNKAGEAHVTRGLGWMKLADRESAKKAYREFQTALGYLPGDIKTEQLAADAFGLAVVNIVVTQIDNDGFQFSSYNGNLRNTGDEMVSNLVYNSGNEFVRFYSVPDARNRQIVPDQVIELRLNGIDPGPLQESRFTKEVSKEVVIKEIVYRKDSVVNVYGKVKARITTVRKTLVADGSLGITIRDNKGVAQWHDNAIGESRWFTECSSYTGDERALSVEDKHLINKRPDNIPGESGIIDCVKKEIFNNALYRIRDYYSRY